ncbi:MAG: hypothetical protein IJT31_07485 [Oscillibacter sp.]|nr:hypothetical protein [Oscillibacter sp.]
MSDKSRPPFPFSEDERMFKAAYEAGGREFVDKPMSFEVYLNLLNSGVLANTPNSPPLLGKERQQNGGDSRGRGEN